jgi:D-serine deaminase-like pyridoxal phosphate-dependent protein
MDMGSHRAGLPPDTPQFAKLVQAVEAADSIDLDGFYAYASHVSITSSVAEAERHLKYQVDSVITATRLLEDRSRSLTLSFGSTPTANVIAPIREKISPNITFEIHAGLCKDYYAVILG